jgi:hypothetical protein
MMRGWGSHVASICAQTIRLFEVDAINVTPAPIFARLEGLDDGVMRRMKMFGGVLVFGAIAAADVATGEAEAEMDPGVAGLQAVFAALGAGFDGADFIDVFACGRHERFASLSARAAQ